MKCSATTKSGEPCRMAAVNGTKPAMCFNHAPGRAADKARAKARSAGGKLRQMLSLEPVVAECEEFWFDELDCGYKVEAAVAHVATEVMQGRMDARRAAAAAGALKLLLTDDAWHRHNNQECSCFSEDEPGDSAGADA
jgi:hypothetical protein